MEQKENFLCQMKLRTNQKLRAMLIHELLKYKDIWIALFEKEPSNILKMLNNKV